MSAENENASNLLYGSVKSEVVCILKRAQTPDKYLVFSLKEIRNEQGTSFALFQTPTAEVPTPVADELVIDSLPEYLQSGKSQYVHVVVSKLSGIGLAEAFYKSVLEPLLTALGLSASEASISSTNLSRATSAAPNSYNLVFTQDAASIQDFARSLGKGIQTGSDPQTPARHTVILLSGDGGVVEMLNGKAPTDESIAGEKQVPLIVMLPLGTGNALFTSLHKAAEPPVGASSAPSAFVRALRTLLLTGRAVPLPSFKAMFPPGSRTITYTEPGSTTTTENKLTERSDAVTHLHGAIVASYGFHSQLVWESDTPTYRRHGAARFGMVAQELLKENHAYRAEVELITASSSGPGKRKTVGRDYHAYILATLVSNLEKTFCISPASRPLDGHLWLVHFGPVSPELTMDIMMQAYDGGKHVGMSWEGEGGTEDGLGYEDINEVHITTQEEDPRWRKFCVDGMIVEVPRGGAVVVCREKGAHLLVLVDRAAVSPNIEAR